MPFERNNNDAQKRKDRDSKAEGKRRRGSLEKKPLMPPQLVVLIWGLEGANCWFPLTLNKSRIEDHVHVPMLQMAIDADMSRFKTIVLERPSEL